jgi:hypothetical protein
MVDFGKVLAQTLRSANAAFDQADRDLHEVVSAVGGSLEKITDGAVQLLLVRYAEALEGCFYRLILASGRLSGLHPQAAKAQPHSESHRMRVAAASGVYREESVVAYLRVPTTGYPIWIASLPEGLSGGGPQRPAEDRAQLEEYFKELASNPDSRLVSLTTFLVRNRLRKGVS